MQSLRRVGVISTLTGGPGGVRRVSSSDTRKPKTGILMLNMGGPRNSDEVQEFLTNLFADRSPCDQYSLLTSLHIYLTGTSSSFLFKTSWDPG